MYSRDVWGHVKVHVQTVQMIMTTKVGHLIVTEAGGGGGGGDW